MEHSVTLPYYAAAASIPALPAAHTGSGPPHQANSDSSPTLLMLQSPLSSVAVSIPSASPSPAITPRFSPYMSLHGDRTQQASLQPSTLSLALLQQQQQLHGHAYALSDQPEEREQLIDHTGHLPMPVAASQPRFFFSPALAAVSSAASSISSAILPQHSPLPSASDPQLGLSSARNASGHVKRLTPSDIAGAHKKDDSLQTVHGSLSPSSMQQSNSAVNASASKTRGDRSLYRQSLTKLTVESQSVLVRVKRAMSTSSGTSSVSGGVLYSSSGSAGGGGTTAGGFSTASLKQSLIRRWKDLPLDLREKLLFAFASLIGTGLFMILFECFYRLLAYNLDLDDSTTFTVSYVVAYLISILYQHLLNRLLVFAQAPYCSSLCHTYAVYSISLVLLTVIGATFIRALHVSPRLIACITLPASGIVNFTLLRACLDNNPAVDGGPGGSIGGAGSSCASTSMSMQMAALHKQERAALLNQLSGKSPTMINSGEINSGNSGSNSSSHSSLMDLAANASDGSGLRVQGGPAAVTLLPLQSPLHVSSSPPTPGDGPVLPNPALLSGFSAGGPSIGSINSLPGGGGIVASAATPSPFGNRRFPVTHTTKKPHSWQHYSAALYTNQQQQSNV
jgi:hypothetical protein